MKTNGTEIGRGERLARLSAAVKTILECVGEDPEREGLRKTPERFAKAILFLTNGYNQDLRAMVNNAVFKEDCHEMVIVKDIEFFSLCEHHILPFAGKVNHRLLTPMVLQADSKMKIHIGYIPKGQVIGLSKIARVVDVFSRRLQIQERLTKQVGDALAEILQPQGIAIVAESSHFCMKMRGIKKIGAITTTVCMLGCLESSSELRREFLSLIS